MSLSAPYFIGKNFKTLEARVSKIYSDPFLNPICEQLKVEDGETREAFKKYLKQVSTSYLNAIDMNSDRLQPNQQRKALKNYSKALREAQARLREVEKHNSTSANYHDALRDLVSKTEEPGMQDMFHPYVGKVTRENELSGIAITIFDKFFDVLIEAAENAPAYISDHDKADLKNDYILWWLYRIAIRWPEFTDVPFTLGDWYPADETIKGESSKPKKGFYKSRCIDALHALLNAVNADVTRSNIETAMAKYKKL